MKNFLGTKHIKAVPMTKYEYNAQNKRNVPGEDSPGYLVQYHDVNGVFDYSSWSPKDVFEQSYRPCDGLTFGLAIEAMKMGKKVSRSGWNGKGMWLSLVTSDSYSVPNKNYVSSPEFAGEPHLLPWIGMKTADNGFVPWLASQTDVLADDWVIKE